MRVRFDPEHLLRNPRAWCHWRTMLGPGTSSAPEVVRGPGFGMLVSAPVSRKAHRVNQDVHRLMECSSLQRPVNDETVFPQTIENLWSSSSARLYIHHGQWCVE